MVKFTSDLYEEDKGLLLRYHAVRDKNIFKMFVNGYKIPIIEFMRLL